MNPFSGTTAKPTSILGVVLVLAVLPAIPALGGEYLWLDHAHIDAGLAYPKDGIWGAFSTNFAGTGYFRPLMTLSLLLDRFLGFGPLGARVHTLLWHLATVAATFRVGRAIELSPERSAVAASVVSLHPAAAMVSSLVAFRSESMMTFFLLGGLLAVGFRRSGSAFACALLAGLSKETSLLLLPLMLLASRVAFSESVWWGKRNVALAAFCGSAVALAMRLFAAGDYRAVSSANSLSDAFHGRGVVFGEAIRTLLLATSPRVSDAVSHGSWASVSALTGFALFIAVAIFAAQSRRFVVLLGIALVPLLELVPLSRLWSPHYLYVALPFLGLCLASIPHFRFDRVVLGVGLAFAGVKTFECCATMTSDAAFFGAAVVADSRFAEGEFFLGEVARKKRDFRAAKAHYERALEVRREFRAYLDERAALQNLGCVLLELSEFEAARNVFRQARARSLNSLDRELARYHEALSLVAVSRLAEALALLEEAEGQLGSETSRLLSALRASMEKGTRSSHMRPF